MVIKLPLSGVGEHSNFISQDDPEKKDVQLRETPLYFWSPKNLQFFFIFVTYPKYCESKQTAENQLTKVNEQLKCKQAAGKK